MVCECSGLGCAISMCTHSVPGAESARHTLRISGGGCASPLWAAKLRSPHARQTWRTPCHRPIAPHRPARAAPRAPTKVPWPCVATRRTLEPETCRYLTPAPSAPARSLKRRNLTPADQEHSRARPVLVLFQDLVELPQLFGVETLVHPLDVGPAGDGRRQPKSPRFSGDVVQAPLGGPSGRNRKRRRVYSIKDGPQAAATCNRTASKLAKAGESWPDPHRKTLPLLHVEIRSFRSPSPRAGTLRRPDGEDHPKHTAPRPGAFQT